MIDIAKNVVKNLPTEQNSGKSIENFYKTATEMACNKRNEEYEKELVGFDVDMTSTQVNSLISNSLLTGWIISSSISFCLREVQKITRI